MDTHRVRNRSADRARMSHEAGVRAMRTPAGRELCARLGVEITSLERWDDKSGGRTWYVGLAGQNAVHGHRSTEFRTASSLSRLVRAWRRAQGNDKPMPSFTSPEASAILALMHKAVESSEDHD